MNKEKRIEQFKRELRSLAYYKEAHRECNDKLESINNALVGVSSPTMSEAPIENKSYKNYRIYDLMEEEEKIVQERNFYRYSIKNIEIKLAKLNEQERELLFELFVKNNNYDEVANKMHCSRSKLFYDVNNIISRII